MVKVTNTPRPCPDDVSATILITKVKITHVWACGSINVIDPSGLRRPCRSTSTQVLLLSTTLWCAKAAIIQEIFVPLSPVWFVPDHFSSMYPVSRMEEEELQRKYYESNFGHRSLRQLTVAGQQFWSGYQQMLHLHWKSGLRNYTWTLNNKKKARDTHMAKLCSDSTPLVFWRYQENIVQWTIFWVL